MSKNYYVYLARYRGIIVYVGHGCGDRINHVCSGTSSSRQLNELYFRKVYLKDEPVVCEKVKTGLTKEQATKAEAYLIKKHNPLCNTTGKSKKRLKDFMYSDEISRYSKELGLSADFDSLCFTENSLLAFTGVGLPVTIKSLDDFSNSAFDLIVSDGGYRIKVKYNVVELLVNDNPEIVRYYQPYIGSELGFSDNILSIPQMVPIYLKDASTFFKIENVFNSHFETFLYRKFHTIGNTTLVRYVVENEKSYDVYNITEDRIDLILSTGDKNMAKKVLRSSQEKWITNVITNGE